jgi:hypothetical protein
MNGRISAGKKENVSPFAEDKFMLISAEHNSNNLYTC